MQIHQKRYSMNVTEPLQFFFNRLVVRYVNLLDAAIDFLFVDRAEPDFADPRDTSRDETKAVAGAKCAARTLVGLLVRIHHHPPIDVIARPVEVNHRSRRACLQKTYACPVCNPICNIADTAIFQPKTRG